MKKSKLTLKLILALLVVLLVLVAVGIYVEYDPRASVFVSDKLAFVYFGNKASSLHVQNSEGTAISYKEKQVCMEICPDVKYRGKVYYDLYGKRVYENDVYINLSDVQIDENLADNLKNLPKLREVELYNQNLTNEQKIKLQDSLPNVLFKWKVEILDEEVEWNTEELDFSKRKINNIEEFKMSLRLLPNLKKLDMSYTNLSNEQLGQLRVQFPNTRIDWVIHMSKWSCRTDAVAFSVLVYTYDYRRMTTQDIQVLKYCTELQALDLGHQAIEDITVIGDYLPNLRVLILADNRIKDISPLAKLKHLHYLELFMNDITDSTPLAECKELVDLNISFNYRFSNINGILNLPKLERLWLISDSISADSYNLIRRTYPNVILVTTGSGSTNSGWRTHERYYAMIDMYRKNYISDVFLKYDD
jgi:Leucine-rich repeat (LRR) protein